MDREHHTVSGAPGAELDLPIAGPGSRSYAFLIDWHIRALLALAWLVVGLLAINGGLRWSPGGGGKPAATVALLAVLPALVIYLLYHPIVELWMRGQTPGKRMAGVRIVNAQGGLPSGGAILIRNVFRLIDSLPALYCVGLACTFMTRQRVRVGDLAAGTFLMVDEPVPPAAFDSYRTSSALGDGDIAGIELARQILERWPELEPGRRRQLARSLLGRIEREPAAGLDALTETELQDRLRRVAAPGAGA